MKASVKIALGIDIGESHVGAVVLKRTANGLKVLKAGQLSMDEGVLEAGRAVDPARLTKVLRTVKRRYGRRSGQVAVALPIGSTLSRVVALEENDPQRIARFIQEEVRQYAAFSGRETVSDYRLLSPATADAPGKAFVTAADRTATSTLTRAFDSAGIAITDMEPAVALCVGTFDGVMASLRHPTGHRITALLKDNSLILCVFRSGLLDFVHTKSVDSGHENVAAVYKCVTDEINAVIKFYCLKDIEARQPWTVVLADDAHSEVSPDAKEALQTGLEADDVVLLTRRSAFQRLGITSAAGEEASITAVGLAMRLLTVQQNSVKMNLLPEDAVRARAVKRHVLMAAIVLSCLVLCVVLVIGGLRWRVDCINRRIAALNAEESRSGVVSLPVAVAQLDAVNEQIAAVSAKLDCIDQVEEFRFEANWVQLLMDISQAIPHVVRITELSLNGTSDVLIEGLSQTYPAVHMFSEALTRSDQICRTEVKEMGVGRNDQTYVRYKILCTLVPRKSN